MDVSLFLGSTIEQTTPILLAALAAMITLRANILNVAVEGMMLAAAFTAIAVGGATGSATFAFFAALVAALAMALIFGIVAINLRADFIVAGLGLNLLSAGGTLFLLERVYNNPGGLRPDTFPDIWHIPDGSLAWLPIVGPAFEGQSFIVLLALLAIPGSIIFLYRTPVGYALRAAGEEERAAHSAGIRVGRMRLLSVMISGFFAGLAGAQLAMDKLHFFLPDITSGRGFIGLAAALFGSGLPGATAAASLLFGAFGAIGDRLQVFAIPPQFVLATPYVAAILGLVVARLRATARNRPARVSEKPL